MNRTVSFASLAALSALALAPLPAAAQLRLIPQVGLYTPFSKLPSPSAGADELKKEATLAYGLALELGTPDAVSFRVNALHATDSEVPVGDVGCQDDCARSTVSTLSGTLAIRPIPNLILVRPYALLGGGLKRYDFTKDDLQDEGVSAVLSDQNQLTGHVGLGLELNLGIARVVGELSDMLSKFENTADDTTDLQHDVFFTVGLAIGD